MADKLKVLLTTEGTYPFYQGGVSTWCDLLVRRMPDIDFTIYCVLANPFVTQKYQLPEDTEVLRVPLWGTEEPSEHLNVPFSHILQAKHRTDAESVKEHFLPIFRDLVEEIVSPAKDPVRFGHTLLAMNEYMQVYEYKSTFKSELVWQTYKSFILEASRDSSYRLSQPDVYGLIQSLGWLYRFLNIVNTPIPEVDVTHSSASAFCGIPCAISKLKRGTPYLLSEHGVYLREQYLNLSKQGYSSFLGTFLIRFVQSVVELNYATADQVSPVCAYNMRWEKRFGVPVKNVKVIYNGVDENVFRPGLPEKRTRPTAVLVARIDPLKDIKNFLQAAALVREKMPDVLFLIYGSVSVKYYYEECMELHERLNLKGTVVFAGHTNNVSAAYQSGDIVVLSSISEAFPYSVVEGMMSGKPVVATDVGGVKEAIGDTGIVVPPRDSEALAAGIYRLLSQPDLCRTLGQDAHERAMNAFTLEKVLDLHLQSYRRLAAREAERSERIKPSARLARQQLLLARGFAMASVGMEREAIAHFREAIEAHPASVHVPVVLTEIASAYNRLGKFDEAFMEMERAEAYAAWLETSTGA